MGKNNRKWTRWGSGNGSEGGWSSGGSSSGGTQKDAEPKQGKNWKCELCSYTNNCAWWWRCGRESCQADWVPKAANGNEGGTSTASAAPNELATAREKLATLATILEPGDASLAVWADKVKSLEDAQKTGVSAAERLRRLLQTQKQHESKQTAALAAMAKAKAELAKATAALKGRMEDCEAVVADIAANTLEIAEVTRSAAPATSPVATTGGINMVQDLRTQIEILQPGDIGEAGLDLAGLGQFFVVFNKILCLLDRAKGRTDEAAPQPDSTTGAVEAAAPQPASTSGEPASSQIPNGQPDPIQDPTQHPSARTLLPVDNWDDDDGDKEGLTDMGAALMEIEKAEKLLDEVCAADSAGSSG